MGRFGGVVSTPDGSSPSDDPVDAGIAHLFAMVSEALAGATHALLGDERDTARMVVERDQTIDDLAASVERVVWDQVQDAPRSALRRLVVVLLILPELERSADLAEHVAQRALTGLGREMSPLSRGVVQRMTEVGLEMWETVARAYRDRSEQGVPLDEADEELDILHQRLTHEVASGSMDPATAAQVTLLARFYERLGDHAVNLARRIGTLTRVGDEEN